MLLKCRQHEVQAVAGPDGRLAIAWTDDSDLNGLAGWTSGFAVREAGNEAWSSTLFHKRADFFVTGNPTVAIDQRGVVFAVAMSALADHSRGLLEITRSHDAGQTWSPWRTIVSKENGIPDRPRLAADRNGVLILAYASIEHTGRRLKVMRGIIEATRSTDGGSTWSAPIVLSPLPRRSRWFLDGYQGAALTTSADGRIAVSWADYYGNRAHFLSGDAAAASFDRPIAMALRLWPGTGLASWALGATFGTPATGLAIDHSGQHVVLSVHEAHAMSHIVLLGSRDRGKTWSRRCKLTRRGTNVALAYDALARLHAIWTELDGQLVDTKYAISHDHGDSFGPATSLAGGSASVKLPSSVGEREAFEEALGSYQSLIITEAGDAHAFWIDFRQGLTRPELAMAHWRV